MIVSNLKLGIALPLSFHMVPSAFFDSFITMEKPPFIYLRTSNGPIDKMRDSLVESALEAGCSHLIMMDTDQVYHPRTITRLLSHKLPAVGCLVYRRYPPFDPLMMKGSLGKYETIADWEPNSLVEVDATGTGCIMFNMSVFRKMPMPWFESTVHEDKPVGEDIGFCAKMRNAGYKIYVDTSIPAGHLSQIQITDAFWRMFGKVSKEVSVSQAAQSTTEHDVVKITGLEGG